MPVHDESEEAMEVEDPGEAEDGEASVPKEKKVYVPGKSRALKKDEELVVDESCYTFFHQFQTALPDGEPLSCTLVAGTQAENVRDNSLLFLRLSNLHPEKAKADKDSDDESSDDESSDEEESQSKEPQMHSVSIAHHGAVNRLRVSVLGVSKVCAVWNDQGKVQVWNLANAFRAAEILAVDGGSAKSQTLKKEKPLFTFAGHHTEGFAIDWSCVKLGQLASGDVRKNIHIWTMNESGGWLINQIPLSKHTASVEDLQWSPQEDSALASCSSDRTIRLWDTRSPAKDACVCTVDSAHDGDVNVISWNAHEPLLLSGGDDGALKIWDLRVIQKGQPVARFKHHTAPITAVHWNPNDSTVFAASGEDDQVTIWDLAVEPDVEEGTQKAEVEGVPPQLLFIHQGQKQIKDVRWIAQHKGLIGTSALDGFNLFRTISV